MTLDELIAVCQTRVDDAVGPRTFVDPEQWRQYAIQAQREAAERALLLRRQFVFPIQRGKAQYPLNPLILFIRRVTVQTTAHVLYPTDIDELDRWIGPWESIVGSPTAYLTDERHLTVYPSPDQDYTLRLDTYCYPKDPGSGDCFELEISEKDHYYLTHWMCYEALTTMDVDLEHTEKAEMEYSKFERRFGPPRDALAVRHLREIPPNRYVQQRPLV